ncbi:MAG: hypothetical protein QNJ60_17065 [Xenococcaceae cyanobacterium MO_188.B19]|nr:hypothetical protein [Xenococcaceae cyanobacterium MO_188.B19]
MMNKLLYGITQISFAALLSVSTTSVLSIKSVSAQNELSPCINWAVNTYEISQDLAYIECQKYLLSINRQKSRPNCISIANQVFLRAFYTEEAANKASSFCNNGGKARCITQMYKEYLTVFHKKAAANKAASDCI